MKAYLFLLASIATGYSVGASCLFDGTSLNDVGRKAFFRVSQAIPTPVPYPDNLFRAYRMHLGTFAKKACENAVVSTALLDKETGQNYTAFYTNVDDCDGGNSYGVIVAGARPDPSQAVATIQDSFFYCIP